MVKWRYGIITNFSTSWRVVVSVTHTLATLSHNERASDTHCTEGCMSSSTTMGAWARIPPPGTEPNSVIIQPIYVYTSEHFIGG